jgi:hypothetical protein
MLDITDTAPALRSQSIFFSALGIATALPLLGLGFGIELFHQDTTYIFPALWGIMAATGVGHVAATAFFYADPGFGRLIREDRQRFLLWPFIAMVACYAVFSINTAAWAIVSKLFIVWQLYHYQRQNYGVIAFAAQSGGFGRLPQAMNLMLNLGVAGGACALFVDTSIGVAVFAGSTAVLAYMLLIDPRLRRNSRVLCFTLLGWAFLLPTLVSADPLVSFWSYAIAHGAQYLIFLAVLSVGHRFGLAGPVILVFISVATWMVFACLLSAPATAAIYTGIVMGHFLIDAKLWRLREPTQRGLIRERFAFIFGHPA